MSDNGQNSRRRPRRGRVVAPPNGDGAVDVRPVDETAASVTLPEPGEPFAVFTPGEPEMADEGPRSLRGVLREALDYSSLRDTPYGLRPVLLLAAISFFQTFDSAAYSLAAPDIARDLSINVYDIVGIQVLVGTFTIFAAIFAGWYADRHARVPFITAGTLLSGIFSIVTGRGRSFSGIATPRVIDDTADEASTVPHYSLLTDYYPFEVRGKVFALIGTLSRVATLLAPVAAAYSIVHWGWDTAFLIFGIPLILVAIVVQAMLREPVRGYFERKAMGATEEEALREDEPQSFGEAWRATLGIRTVRRVMLADVFSHASDYVFFLFLPFFLADRYGLDALERAYVALPAIAASLIGGFVGGGLVDMLLKRNPSRVFLVFGVATVLLVPTQAMFVLEPPLWTIVVVNTIAGFGISLIGPAVSVIYSQVIPPSIRTQGLQITRLSTLLTPILLLPIARNFYRDYDYEGVFLYTIPFAVIGSLIFLTASGFIDLDIRNNFAQARAAEEWRRAKAAGSTKLLIARNVDVEYDGVQVLFDIDLDIEEGEIVALLGTNGAGKSTLLRAISGVAQASGGGIVFNGRDITHMPPHEITARGVVQMPGGRGVFPEMSVRENLLLATWLLDDPGDVTARLEETFEIFPALRERADLPAGLLSGGEQQQLSLAQGFLCRPKLLLIDELSLGLAPTVVAQLVEIVREINRRGVTVIVVEQSVNVALTIADRALFMEKGEIRFDGSTADLLARPDILRAVYVKGTGALTASGAPRSASSRARMAELESSRAVLEVVSARKRYGGIPAVDDVSFELRAGEVLGLIGPNGAGKTTLFDLISGHQPVDAGVIRLEGVDITHLPAEVRAQRGLVRRFQDARLFPSLTVQETLLVALEQRLDVRAAVLNAFQPPQVRRAERRIRARADKLIELLELESYRDKFVKELSTGLRRIVDLACVLAAEPKVLLLDEPSTGIAQAEAEGLAPLLRRVRHETGCSILIIEHDMPLISAVSDELLALDQGAVVVRGAPDDVLNDERVVQSYLGTSEAAVRRSGSLL